MSIAEPVDGVVSKIRGLGDIGDVRTWLTVAIVTGFFCVYGANWWTSGHATGDPQQAATKTLDLMNGALIAQFTGVVGYWIGSSRGSDAKTAILASDAGKPSEEEKPG